MTDSYYSSPPIWLELAIDSVHSDSIDEHGAGNLNLQIEDQRDNWVSIQPAVELQAEWPCTDHRFG